MSWSDLLPRSYMNRIESVDDVPSENGQVLTVRVNFTSRDDAQPWLEEFSRLTKTSWIVRDSNNRGMRMEFSKTWLCHHSGFGKMHPADKRDVSKNTDCKAQVYMKLKLDTPATRRKDPFIEAGYRGVIQLRWLHNHPFDTVETLRSLRPTADCRNEFFKYFEDGFGPVNAARHHREQVISAGFSDEDLNNAQLCPRDTTIRRWYAYWKSLAPEKMEDVMHGKHPRSDDLMVHHTTIIDDVTGVPISVMHDGQSECTLGESSAFYGEEGMQEIVITDHGGHEDLLESKASHMAVERVSDTPPSKLVSHRQETMVTNTASTSQLSDEQLAAMPVDPQLVGDERRETIITELTRELALSWRQHWDEDSARKMLGDLRGARQNRQRWLAYVTEGSGNIGNKLIFGTTQKPVRPRHQNTPHNAAPPPTYHRRAIKVANEQPDEMDNGYIVGDMHAVGDRAIEGGVDDINVLTDERIYKPTVATQESGAQLLICSSTRRSDRQRRTDGSSTATTRKRGQKDDEGESSAKRT